MKKFNLDNKYVKISLSAFAVIAMSILFEKILGNVDSIASQIDTFISFSLTALQPFIFGFFCAYFLDPAVGWVCKNVFARFKLAPELSRTLSIVIIYTILFGSLTWGFVYLVPELSESIQGVVLLIPNAVQKLRDTKKEGLIYQVLDTYNSSFGTDYSLADIVDIVTKPLLDSITSLPKVFGDIIARTFGFASTILNFVLGIVIAFYMLSSKNKLRSSIKKIIYVVFGTKKSRKMISAFHEYNSIFQNFIIGKTVDSIIVAILFFIVCSFLGLPYLSLLSFIIGVTNMIPYFGPFIGAIPVVIIILIRNNFASAVWVAIIILILQQFDGIILGPKILGESTGLKPMEVIFAITIGGAMFGVFGMFFGVPVFAVILKILRNITNRKYEELKENE